MSPKVALQYLLPHRLLSRIAYGVARTRTTWFKDWLIALVIRKFGVDMSEAADPEPRNYLHFNAFFTVGSSRVDLQACKLEYSIVSPK